MQQEIATTALLYITSYFAIINPLGVMPVFMTMTSTLDDKQRSILEHAARTCPVALSLREELVQQVSFTYN